MSAVDYNQAISTNTMFGYYAYMKFDNMAAMTESLFKDSEYANETEVNVYIDLASILEKMYYSMMLIPKMPTTFASAIINLAGHMRMYFRNCCSVYANVYFVYSKNEWSVLRKMIPEWNQTNINHRKEKAYIEKYMNDALKLVSEVCKYLPNVYYIEREEEATCIMGMIIKQESSHPNIIISKEINALQLAINSNAFLYWKDCHKLGSHIHFGIGRKNLLESYLKITRRWNPVYDGPEKAIFIRSILTPNGYKTEWVEKTKRLENIGYEVQKFNPDNFGLFLGMSHLISKDVKHLLNWTRAVKELNNYGNTPITDYIELYNRLNNSCKIYKKISYEDFNTRLMAVSVKDQVNLAEHLSGPITGYKINLNDPEKLKYINDHYFKEDFIVLEKF